MLFFYVTLLSCVYYYFLSSLLLFELDLKVYPAGCTMPSRRPPSFLFDGLPITVGETGYSTLCYFKKASLAAILAADALC